MRGTVGAWSYRLAGAGDGGGFWLGGIGSLVGAVESASLHSGDGFRVLHEGIPDEGAAKIFCHKDADAEVDAEHVGFVPVEIGVEGVAKAVASPGFVAEVFFEGAEDTDAVMWEKG